MRVVLLAANCSDEDIAAFDAGLRTCYEALGASVAATSSRGPHLRLLVVINQRGELVAGGRLQFRTALHRLPFESRVDAPAAVRHAVEARAEDGVAELGAMWQRADQLGSNLGGVITLAALAFAPVLGARHVVGLGHRFHKHLAALGFERDLAIGEHPYPDARYPSMVWWRDATVLELTHPSLRATHDAWCALAPSQTALPLVDGRRNDVRTALTQTARPQRRRPFMASYQDKIRPFRYPTRLGTAVPFTSTLTLTESMDVPRDVAELVGTRTSILGTESGATTMTLAIRNAETGSLLATARVSPATDSPLANHLSYDQLERTQYISHLAWADDAAPMASVVLYAALRRARIAGAASVAVSACDPTMAVTEALSLRALTTAPPTTVRTAHRAIEYRWMGQRLDIAIASAARAMVDCGGGTVLPSALGLEIEETVERWIEDTYQHGFMKSVFDRTLTREQYVSTLGNMYQFVKWTTRLLGRAVSESHDRPLRNHFLSHLQGEVNHEIIIERDLAHLGENVEFVTSTMQPSPGTRHFMAVQESLVGFHGDAVSFMASPLAAEGLSAHLTTEFVESLHACIESWGVRDPQRASMFFTSHIHADGGDDGHWESTMALLTSHVNNDNAVAAFLANLRASMSALGTAYDEYVASETLFEVRQSAMRPIPRINAPAVLAVS